MASFEVSVLQQQAALLGVKTLPGRSVDVQPAGLWFCLGSLCFLLATGDFQPALPAQRSAGRAQFTALLEVTYVLQDALIHGASIG